MRIWFGLLYQNSGWKLVNMAVFRGEASDIPVVFVAITQFFKAKQYIKMIKIRE